MAISTKARGVGQVHAVLGSDEAEVKRAARELAQRLMPESGSEFACDTIDGCVDDAAQAAHAIHQTIEALLTYPFFGGEKLVWLKNATFLADSPTGRAAAVAESLEKLGATLNAGVPEGTRFLLSALEADKRRTFYKTLAKVAKVQVYDRINASREGWEEAAAQLGRELAEARRLQLAGEALQLFTLLTGGDRRMIENELEKLDLFLGANRREITIDDVRTLVPLSRAGIIFELGNALAARDLRRCLDLLEQLLFQGESALGILLVAIIPTMRNLLLAKDLIVRHRLARPHQAHFFGKALERLPAEAIAHLPRKKDGTMNLYTLGLAAVHAQRYQTGELREALASCLRANVALVTTQVEPVAVLSQLIIRLASPRSRTSSN